MDTDLLHRQIHPTHNQSGIVSNLAFSLEIGSSAFVPIKTHNGYLSVYNGSSFSPEDSYRHYVKTNPSDGVLSLSRDEVLSVEPLNTIDDNIPFIGHSSIDFNSVANTTQIKKKAVRLRNLAIARKWTYYPNKD
jgi:hypothetical protein